MGTKEKRGIIHCTWTPPTNSLSKGNLTKEPGYIINMETTRWNVIDITCGSEIRDQFHKCATALNVYQINCLMILRHR